jgi:hypothetical protein
MPDEYTIEAPTDDEYTIEKPQLKDVAAKRKARLEAEGGGTATQQVEAAKAKDVNFGGGPSSANFAGPVGKEALGAYGADRVKDTVTSASMLVPGGWVVRAAIGAGMGAAGGYAREKVRTATGSEHDNALALTLGLDTAFGTLAGLGKGPTPWKAAGKEIEMALMPKMVMRAAQGDAAGGALLNTAMANTRSALDEAIRAVPQGPPILGGAKAGTAASGDVEAVYKTLSSGLRSLRDLAKNGGRAVEQVNAMTGKVAELLDGVSADVSSGMSRHIQLDKLIEMKGRLQQYGREVLEGAVKNSPQWREGATLTKAAEELHAVIRKTVTGVSDEAAALYDQANRLYSVLQDRSGLINLAETQAKAIAKRTFSGKAISLIETGAEKVSSWMIQKAWGDASSRVVLQKALEFAKKGDPISAKMFAARAFAIAGADKGAEHFLKQQASGAEQPNYVPPPPE